MYLSDWNLMALIRELTQTLHARPIETPEEARPDVDALLEGDLAVMGVCTDGKVPDVPFGCPTIAETRRGEGDGGKHAL
jgi:hypothetical protein